MPITLLDGIFVGFLLISAMLAMIRGFSREILSIASWIIAGFASFFLYPIVLPYIAPHIGNAMIALALAVASVFLIVLIIATIITMKIADFIIDSRIGALDRTLGFVYGAVRGVIVMAVAFLFMSWLLGSAPPAWITEAKSKPLLEGVGNWLQELLPADSEKSILDRLSPVGEDETRSSN